MKVEAKITETNSRTLLFRRTFFVSPSLQDPSKRAQFRVALLGGGARPRERARKDRPGGGRERNPRRERAKNEGRGPEIGGERVPTGGTSLSRAELSAFTKDLYIYIHNILVFGDIEARPQYLQ